MLGQVPLAQVKGQYDLEGNAVGVYECLRNHLSSRLFHLLCFYNNLSSYSYFMVVLLMFFPFSCLKLTLNPLISLRS